MKTGGVVVARGLSTLMESGVVIEACHGVGNIRPTNRCFSVGSAAL